LLRSIIGNINNFLEHLLYVRFCVKHLKTISFYLLHKPEMATDIGLFANSVFLKVNIGRTTLDLWEVKKTVHVSSNQWTLPVLNILHKY
jgi:hypothetical protein